MNHRTLIAAAALLSAFQAHAVATLTAGPSTAEAGASVETFEGFALGDLPVIGGHVFGSGSPNAALTLDGIYLVSGVSAQPKGGTGKWFSVGGNENATFSFASAQKYVGFLWGSVDTYNTVTFYNGNAEIGSFVGGPGGLPNVPVGNGDQATAQYFNFFADSITSVKFASGSNAFEIDNLATIAAVPEPETYALLLAGLGAMGFVARRRSQAAR